MKRKNDLLATKEELLKVIASLDEIQFYLCAQKKMKENTKIMELIERKKQLQKELVNIKAIGKSGQKQLLEEEISQVEQTLFAIPLYQQYLYAMEDAQQILDEVALMIQETLVVEVE